MSPKLEIQLDRDAYEPGERVSGTVKVLEGGPSRSLEVFLNLCEATRDYRDVSTSIPSGPLHTGDLVDGTAHEFAVALPPEAPPAFTSQHGRMWWELDAKSDERGRDTHATREIEVVIE